MIPTYFAPRTVVNHIEENFYKEESSQPWLHTNAILTVYAMFGCDYSPGFHGFSHGTALKVLDKICKEKFLQTQEDFLEFILICYEEKNSTLRHLFVDNEENNLSEKIMQTRSLIKAVRGCERETIPLLSCLRKHSLTLMIKYITNLGLLGTSINQKN